jgi:predicted Ser/Thr protein kinase
LGENPACRAFLTYCSDANLTSVETKSYHRLQQQNLNSKPTSESLPAKTVVQHRGIVDTDWGALTNGRQRKRIVAEEPQKPKASSQTRVQQLGDFELKKKLGKGGMGEVYLARQISLDRMVALKTLTKELAKKGDFVARFEREAKSMAKIDHPNVVKIYAVDSFKGIHFAAIEYIDGQSVQKWLDHLTQFSVGDSVHIAIICLEALKHAHAENMVHRDIKPDNILITKKGIVKVADFGLAKALDEDVSMTQSGTGLGTPLYMAPEQARNAKHVDHRVDIYALGATLYHMLTGKLPFMGTTALQLIMAKEKGTYAAARTVRSEIPERLDLIIDKLMAKDPNHRYKSCDEAIRDLIALGVHGETLSFIEGAEPVGPGRGGPSTLAAVGGTQQVRRTVAASQGIAGDTASGTTRIWYVQFEDAKGKTVVEKHSTGRILKMLGSGQLTAKTRAKFSSDGAYMPLAQFPEFTKAVEDSLAKKSATIRKEDMASLYKKVEKEQKTFYLKRKIKDVFRSIVGMSSLLLLIAAIGVVGYLLFQYRTVIPAWIAEKVGLTGEPDPNKPERNPIDPLAPPVDNTNVPPTGTLN